MPTDESIQQERDTAAKNMAIFLNEELETIKSNKGASDYKPPAIKVGRGITAEQSTIVFSGDNTAWVLPKEVVKHVNPNLLTNDQISGKARSKANSSQSQKVVRQKHQTRNLQRNEIIKGQKRNLTIRISGAASRTGH